MVKKQSKGVIARVLVRSNLFFIFFLSLIFLTTCGGYDHEGTSGTGNIAFKIDWQNAPTISKNSVENGEIPINPPLEKGGEGGFERTAPLDCTVSGVSTVIAVVYSTIGSHLATGGPWNCSDGSGNIEKVPAGTNRKVVVEGKDSSGNVLYSGEQTGVTVVDGQTSPTVTVTVTAVTTTGTAPSAPTGVSASAGNGQVTISWSSVSGATSYNIYWSTTSDIITNCNLCNKIVNTSTSRTHRGLTNGTTYYYVVTAVNSYGESSESSQVNATPVAPVTPTTLAGLTAKAIAIDSTNVYGVEDSDTIKKVSINGGTVTTLASGLNSPWHIAVDSSSVYWAEYGSGAAIGKVNINGGSVTTLASGLSSPVGIAVDSTSVYWTESSGGTVKKVGINGGTVTTLASGLNNPYGIAIDSTSVYWTEIDAVKKISINGGTVTTLASDMGYLYGIAVDSTNVYWTKGNNGSNGTLKKVSINGGTVTTLASGLYFPEDIALDSTNVYWNELGAVKKIAK